MDERFIKGEVIGVVVVVSICPLGAESLLPFVDFLLAVKKNGRYGCDEKASAQTALQYPSRFFWQN